jgi:hypothetical protein
LSKLRRFAWFIVLWLGGVAATALLGLLVRSVLPL